MYNIDGEIDLHNLYVSLTQSRLENFIELPIGNNKLRAMAYWCQFVYHNRIVV